MDYEADHLERRINVITDESLAAASRIRRVAEETEQIGVETLGTLHEQGEQLNHIENQVDQIEVDLNGTIYNLHCLDMRALNSNVICMCSPLNCRC